MAWARQIANGDDDELLKDSTYYYRPSTYYFTRQDSYYCIIPVHTVTFAPIQGACGKCRRYDMWDYWFSSLWCEVAVMLCRIACAREREFCTRIGLSVFNTLQYYGSEQRLVRRDNYSGEMAMQGRQRYPRLAFPGFSCATNGMRKKSLTADGFCSVSPRLSRSTFVNTIHAVMFEWLWQSIYC